MRCLYVYVYSFKSLIRAKRIQFASHCSLNYFYWPSTYFLVSISAHTNSFHSTFSKEKHFWTMQHSFWNTLVQSKTAWRERSPSERSIWAVHLPVWTAKYEPLRNQSECFISIMDRGTFVSLDCEQSLLFPPVIEHRARKRRPRGERDERRTDERERKRRNCGQLTRVWIPAPCHQVVIGDRAKLKTN